MAWSVVLTVADHEQNGFMSLARWQFPDEAAARAFIEAENAAIPDGAEPDHLDPDVSFNFLLDLADGRWDVVDNSRNLPLQAAMRLAPEQVRAWLAERPDPNAHPIACSWGPLLAVPLPATPN
jgi:hypothetical protein